MILFSFHSILRCIIVTGLCWGGVYTAVLDIWHSGVLLLCTPEYTLFCDKQELHWVQKFDTSALCRSALSRLLKTELSDSKVRCQRMIGGGEAQHPSFHRSSYMFVLCTFTDHLTGLPLPPWSSWVAQFWADTISSGSPLVDKLHNSDERLQRIYNKH